MLKKWSLKEVGNIIEVHEIKQLQAFKEILSEIKSPLPTMIELGAAEGYYTKIFNDYFKDRNMPYRSICLELTHYKVELLKENVPESTILHGYIGELDFKNDDVKIELNKQLPNKYTLKEIFNQLNLSYVDCLHADIQGGEKALIEELDNSFLKKIRFIFLSTHSYEIHQKAYSLLQPYHIITNSTNISEGWGYGDGLIIAEIK